MIQSPQLELLTLKLQAGPIRLELRRPVMLDAGNVYIVQGRSGAGKSSLARVLLGLANAVEPPIGVDGHVTLRDRANAAHVVPVLEGAQYSDEARPLFAYMPQLGSLGFIDQLTVRENARLFSSLDTGDATPALEAIAAKLRLWPLPSSIGRASGGEQMRLSAVRALLPRSREVPRPAVLVADEPTAGLDPVAARELCHSLLEVARDGRTVVIIITHEPERFVEGPLPEMNAAGGAIRIFECAFAGERGGLHCKGEVSALVRTEAPAERSLVSRAGAWGVRALDTIGGLALSPLALAWGLAGMNGRTLRPASRLFLASALNPGTWVFAVGACVMIAVTVGIFIFHLMPRRELVEPLLLPDTLMGFGIMLQLVLIPMFAAIFAVAKNGAAQAAQLSSSVRSGLLDTLALARMRVEGYALVPVVLSQIVSLSIATAIASVVAVTAGALVFMTGTSKMSLSEVVQLMYTGADTYSGWFGWLVAKTLVSGFVGGAIAALFGLRPVRSERDVARAVHSTLLWGMFAVCLIQCAFVIWQFS